MRQSGLLRPTLPPGQVLGWGGTSYWRAESTTWQTGPFWRESLKNGEKKVGLPPPLPRSSLGWIYQSHKGSATFGPKFDLAAYGGIIFVGLRSEEY